MSNILTFKGNRGSATDNRFLQDSDDFLDFENDGNGRFDVKTPVFTGTEHRKVNSDSDWTNQELADLFRVKRLLNAAGVVCDIDRGLTDEGDPWCIFCSEDGEVFIHFCRIDGLYLLDSPSIQKPLRGMDFNALVSDFTNRAIPKAQADTSQDTERRVLKFQRGGKVRLHPSALLSALIWTLYLASEELVLVTGKEESDPSQDDASDVLAGHDQASLVEDSVHDQISDSVLFGNDPLEDTQILSDDMVAVEKSCDTHGHNLQWHQGLVVTANAYAIGLSAIAIACGIMSEHIWQDDRDKDLALLNDAGFDSLVSDDMMAKHSSADVTSQQPQSTVLHKLLEAVLTEDISSDLAMLRDDVREILRTAEAENWSADNASDVFAFAQLLEGKTSGSTTPTVSGSSPHTGDKTTELAPSEKGRGSDFPLDSETGEPNSLPQSPSINFAFDSGAADAFSSIMGSWQPKLYKTSLNDIQLYASFDLAAYDDDIISELISFTSPAASEDESPVGMDEDDIGTIKHLRAFDDAAKSLVDNLISRPDSDLEMIYYNSDMILVDLDAFRVKDARTDTISLEHSDGSVVTIVGSVSDFEMYGLIA